MTEIHPAAAVAFSRSADAYERARPDYPPVALEPLRLSPCLVIVDLAAGTGKLTRPLVRSGATVIAVEPVAEMRGALRASIHFSTGRRSRCCSIRRAASGHGGAGVPLV